MKEAIDAGGRHPNAPTLAPTASPTASPTLQAKCGDKNGAPFTVQGNPVTDAECGTGFVYDATKAETQCAGGTCDVKAGFQVTQRATKGYCAEFKYLPEGSYPARLENSADALQECAQRCTDAAAMDSAYGTTAFYVRDSDSTCACSESHDNCTVTA